MMSPDLDMKLIFPKGSKDLNGPTSWKRSAEPWKGISHDHHLEFLFNTVFHRKMTHFTMRIFSSIFLAFNFSFEKSQKICR